MTRQTPDVPSPSSTNGLTVLEMADRLHPACFASFLGIQCSHPRIWSSLMFAWTVIPFRPERLNSCSSYVTKRVSRHKEYQRRPNTAFWTLNTSQKHKLTPREHRLGVDHYIFKTQKCNANKRNNLMIMPCNKATKNTSNDTRDSTQHQHLIRVNTLISCQAATYLTTLNNTTA